MDWDLENDRNSSSVDGEKAVWVGGAGGLAASAEPRWYEIV